MRRLSESERAEIWDRFESGESLRSISRVWVGRRRRSGPMSYRRGGSGRCRLRSGRRGVCRLRSVMRSRVG